MKYIQTVPLSVYIYPKQRERIEKLQKKIKKESGLHIPLTEIGRICIEKGLPSLMENTEIILKGIR